MVIVADRGVEEVTAQREWEPPLFAFVPRSSLRVPRFVVERGDGAARLRRSAKRPAGGVQAALEGPMVIESQQRHAVPALGALSDRGVRMATVRFEQPAAGEAPRSLDRAVASRSLGRLPRGRCFARHCEWTVVGRAASVFAAVHSAVRRRVDALSVDSEFPGPILPWGNICNTRVNMHQLDSLPGSSRCSVALQLPW